MSIVTWFIPDKYEQKELFRTYCEIDFQWGWRFEQKMWYCYICFIGKIDLVHKFAICYRLIVYMFMFSDKLFSLTRNSDLNLQLTLTMNYLYPFFKLSWGVTVQFGGNNYQNGSN